MTFAPAPVFHRQAIRPFHCDYRY